MTTSEYLGNCVVPSTSENFNRTYHLWGYVELGGELTAIHYNISADIFSASGVLKRTDCQSPLLKILWRSAEGYAARTYFESDDFVVIEDFESAAVRPLPTAHQRGQ